MAKLWDKEGVSVLSEIDAFTVGKDRELDLLLASHDVMGTMAHVTMLQKVGLLTSAELNELKPALREIYSQILSGSFKIEEGVEDIHSQVELLLTAQLGDTGKKVHSGRSRNDQVLVDLRLFLRHELKTMVELINNLGQTLLSRSNETKDVLMPGYTHMQAAMPSSFGLWFAAFAESLADDLINLSAAHQIINQNPLGSAAGYGSSFPLDRGLTTSLLGFNDLNYNVVYAQQSRGKTEWSMANAMASTGLTINKLVSDVCTYMGPDFGFFSLPTEWTTGSSIMPHKKNPDVAELIRGKTNIIINLPQQIASLITNLPTGYHREFQLLKDILFPAIKALKTVLQITKGLVMALMVKENLLEQDKYLYLFSVEEVNKLVLQGVSFRDAYKKVGKSIEEGTFKASTSINHTSEGSIGNLCNDAIQNKLTKITDSFKFDIWLNKERELIES